MVFFPPAKLNLGLHVLGKRDDGYHNLESIFLPTGWTDILEIHVDDNVPDGELSFQSTGLPIPGDASNNLVVRAHQLLLESHDLPGLTIHLHKVIPMGAGLGGGSADGTYALKAINQCCTLGVKDDALAEMAAKLGSDCPFFLHSGPALVSGRGEVIEPLSFALPLHNQWVVIHHPGVHVSTAEAFQNLVPSQRSTSWSDLAHTPIERWHDLIGNDFEPGLKTQHPAIHEALESLKATGARYVQMTGSGAAVFGLFSREEEARAVDLPGNQTYVGRLMA